MSAQALQRLADQDGIRVETAERLSANEWQVSVGLASSRQIPGVPVAITWPHYGTARPRAGDALAEWLNFIAREDGRKHRPDIALPSDIVHSLRQDLETLLHDRYDAYMEAGGHPKPSATGVGAGGGCLILAVVLGALALVPTLGAVAQVAV